MVVGLGGAEELEGEGALEEEMTVEGEERGAVDDKVDSLNEAGGEAEAESVVVGCDEDETESLVLMVDDTSPFSEVERVVADVGEEKVEEVVTEEAEAEEGLWEGDKVVNDEVGIAVEWGGSTVEDALERPVALEDDATMPKWKTEMMVMGKENMGRWREDKRILS